MSTVAVHSLPSPSLQIALQKAITSYVFAANSVLSSATTTAASAAFTQWEGAEINWYHCPCCPLR